MENVLLWILQEKVSLYPRLLSLFVPNQFIWLLSWEMDMKYGTQGAEALFVSYL